MEPNAILQGITTDNLLLSIEGIIEKKLSERLGLIEDKDCKLLTRIETGKLLHVSLPTLNEWTKNGQIVSHRHGKRIYYKSEDIDNAIIKREFVRSFND